MAEPTPEQLAMSRDAAHLLTVLPTVKREMQEMERALENRTLSKLRAQTLTPQEALDAWIEKASYRAIISRMEHKIRAGGLDL